MAIIQASEFKAKCLALMDQVARTGETLTITKNGKPIAELRPHRPPRAESLIGLHKGQVEITGDIVSPVGAELWAVSDDRKLGRKARATIDRGWANGELAVPAIAFWEVGLLHTHGRLRLPTPVREWRNAVLAAGAVELPLDGNIALRALDLAGLHDDPADRFIAATALVHDATLVTADERLLAWRHSLERQDARK